MFKGSSWVIALAFNPHDNILASGDINGEVKLWNLDNGKCIRDLQCRNMVNALAFNPEGNILVLCEHLGFYVGILDLHTKMEPNICTRLFDMNEIRLCCFGTFSPDGSLLAVKNCRKKRVELWDVATVVCIHMLEYKDKDESWIQTIAFSPDGTQLFVGTMDGVVDVLTVPNESKREMLDLLQGTDPRVGKDSPIQLLSDFPRLPGFPLHMICEMISAPTTAQLWREALGK
jgi:WD40 repeat protein